MAISQELQAHIDAADEKFEQMMQDDPILRMIHEENSKGNLEAFMKMSAECLNVGKNTNGR